MTRTRACILLLIIGIILSGCIEDPPSSDTNKVETPAEVVKNYISAFVAGNNEVAYSYLSSEVKAEQRTARLEQKSLLKRYYQAHTGEWNIEIHSIDTISTKNNTSTVNVEIDLYAMGNYADTTIKNLTLIKTDNKWWIDGALNPYSPGGSMIIPPATNQNKEESNTSNSTSSDYQDSEPEFRSPGTHIE